MPLKTTTWRGRNAHYIEEAFGLAEDMRFFKPVILDIGPGGIVKFIADYFPSGPKGSMPIGDKIARYILQRVESPLRKTGVFDLKNYEVEEIVQGFEMFQPNMYVVDREDKVLSAVRRDFPGVKTIKADMTKERVPLHGDIVFCYNVAQINQDIGVTLNNVLGSVNLGGLISINGVTAEDVTRSGHFKKLGQRAYVRIH